MNGKQNENIIVKLRNNPIISVFSGVVYFVMILMTLIVLFNHGIKPGKQPHGASKENNTATFFISIFFILLVLSIVIFVIPSFADLKTLIMQLGNVSLVVVYTIFLIVFFRYLLPSKILNDFPYLITISTIAVAGLLFYKGFSTNYLFNYNITYEKIKMVVLFFCLITTFIIYYSVDPGGIIQKYFGYSLLLTILLSVFAFLYLICLLTTVTGTGTTKGGGLPSISEIPFIPILTVLFCIFIFLLGTGIYIYPANEFFSNPGVSTFVIVFTLLIVILYSAISVINMDKNVLTNKMIHISNTNLINKSFKILFGIIAIGLFISWVGINVQNLLDNPSTTSIVSFILNALVLIAVLAIIRQIITTKLSNPSSNSKKDAFFNIISQSALYIPCLFSDLLNYIQGINSQGYGQGYGQNQGNGQNQGRGQGTGNNFSIYNHGDSKSMYLVLFMIILILLYLFANYIKKKMFLQGGKLFIDKPINTNKLFSVATYEELNGTEKFNYQYGMSFWVFLDSFSPNGYSPSYISLLNYGNKPNVLYNADLNTMIVTMPKPNLKRIKNHSNIEDEKKLQEMKSSSNSRKINLLRDVSNNLLDEYDKDNVIVYKLENVLLQKWNNIILNYTGGTLDIFYNNELVKSVDGIVPYMSLDALTVGQNNGINGGICNLVFFKKPLNAINSYYLYNSVKNKKTPTIE